MALADALLFGGLGDGGGGSGGGGGGGGGASGGGGLFGGPTPASAATHSSGDPDTESRTLTSGRLGRRAPGALSPLSPMVQALLAPPPGGGSAASPGHSLGLPPIAGARRREQ